MEIKQEIKMDDENINGYYEISDGKKVSKIIIKDKEGIQLITNCKIEFDENFISDTQ